MKASRIKHLSLHLSVLLSVLLSLTAFSTAAISDDKAEKLEQLRLQIRDIRTFLITARGQKDHLQLQLRDLEIEMGNINRSLRELGARLRSQTEKLKALSQEKKGKQKELGTQREALAKQIRSSYAMGRQGYMKILLNQQDPSVIGRTLTYYDYFNRARVTYIKDIDQKIAELDQLESTISLETSRLEQLGKEQSAKRDALAGSQKSRKTVLAKLDNEIQSSEQQLERLLEDERELTAILSKLQQTLADIPPDVGDIKPFASFKGQLSLPSSGNIEIRYGTARKVGNLKWQGILISASEGQDVHAIYHGRVAFADWLRGFGLLLIIDHGDGYMSLYGHNQSLYKAVGDWVESGETVATVGNSGGRESPGLYFEIRHNGTPANPVLWCKAAAK